MNIYLSIICLIVFRSNTESHYDFWTVFVFTNLYPCPFTSKLELAILGGKLSIRYQRRKIVLVRAV